MAGAYPDVPSRRMAYDVDGTVVLYRNSSQAAAWTEATAQQREDLNAEAEAITTVTAGAGAENFELVFIFPELREIDGWFAAWRNGGSGNNASPLETSDDTTNGIDGAWTTRIADQRPWETRVYTDAAYRTEITSLAVGNVRGLMSTASNGNSGAYRAAHIYGTITPGETPDRLLFIDNATGLEFTAAKDYGNTPRGGSEDFEWRIKNNSSSLTASTLQYTAQDLYLDSADWYTHTLPGGSTFQATRQIASLAPDTTTGIITTRRITAADEIVGPHAARLLLTTGSWS